jgi:fructokinase
MRIGIDLGGTKIAGIVLDAGGTEIARARMAAPRGEYNATLDAIAELVNRIDPEPELQTPVGIGIPGTISPATGLVKNANSAWLIGHPFDTDLAARLGRQVRVANDANCFAVSEARDGAGVGARVVFGVILGTGAGAGITVDGQPLTGANAIAGEWGHNSLPWMREEEYPGDPCYCGRRGCIETFVSGPAFEQDYQVTSGENLTASDIAAVATAGDPLAIAALERLEDRLARALTSVVNIIDPDVVILGGGLSNIDRLYANLPPLFERYAFSDTFDTPVRRAAHGDAGGVRGAAWLWPETETET